MSEKKQKKKRKQSKFLYKLTAFLSGVVARHIFKRKFLRNEIKGKEGPFVVLATHEAALDFTTLIGATRTPMTFVISESFYSTMPKIVRAVMTRIGVIPKQQFQTSITDIKRMRETIEDGRILVIYPAGLMCEDGLSTPIPEATYKFIQWIGADVYVAKTIGTYFVAPKWSKKKRPGRTYLDIYRLLSKEELSDMPLEEVREKAESALLFDAYREQEKLLIKYKNGDNIEGIENVLYMCPHCNTEFSTRVRNKNVIYCTECGYELLSDEYGFLHKDDGMDGIKRYVSDWSTAIYDNLKVRAEADPDMMLSAKTKFHLIDKEKNKYCEVGDGEITLTRDAFLIKGVISGEEVELSASTANFISLPFTPGKHLEIQRGKTSYRCVLEDGRLVMKFVNLVKIFYELRREKITRC